MKPIRRGFATRGKLLIGSVGALLVGLAIALVVATTGPQAAGAAPRSTGPSAAPSSTSGTGCQVTFAATTWPGQFTAEVAVTNTGSTAIDGWELTFAFPGDQAVSSAWNATFTQTGQDVIATNSDFYDAPIEPGGSRSLGFLGTWQSDDTAPTEFRVNGTACD